MTPKLRIFLLAFAAVLPVDQASKHWISANIHYADRIEIIPGFFDLTHVRNPGGAFSFFATGAFEHRMIFFIGTTLIAITLLLVFLRRLEPNDRLSALALGGILGGAVGNLIDRVAYGEVIDFLDIHLWAYTWPTFNVADSAIVVGVALLVAEIFFTPEPAESEASEHDSHESRAPADPH